MRQFTNEMQTAKLIELGFEKPKGLADAEPSSGKWVRPAYSIGELLSFLPLFLEDDLPLFVKDDDYYALTIRKSKVMYCDPYLDWIELEWAKSEELIDNLFDACVELKEEGKI